MSLGKIQMKSNENGLIVYHPSRLFGGTEVLIINLIRMLKPIFKDIFVVDYTDGVLKNELSNDEVTFYDMADISTWITHLHNKKIFLSAKNLARMLFLANKENLESLDFFSWVLHPSELYSGYALGTSKVKNKIGYFGLSFYLKLVPGFTSYSKIIERLNHRNNICFMDESCFQESNWFFCKRLSENYLPLITDLTVSGSDCNEACCDNQKATIEFMVISRLEDFKTAGIVKLIDDLSNYIEVNKGECIKLHVIGDGNDYDKINAIAKNCGKNLEVILYGYIKKAELGSFFRKYKISALFSTGTSALEGVSRGVFTVLLPATDRKIKIRNAVYKIMHMQSSCSLGEYIGTPFETPGYLSLLEVIGKIKDNSLNNSEKIKNYFELYYSKSLTEENVLRLILRENRVYKNELHLSPLAMIFLSFLYKVRESKGV